MKNLTVFLSESKKESLGSVLSKTFLKLLNSFKTKKMTDFRKEVKKYMEDLPNTDEKLIAADFTELFLKVDGSQSYYQIKAEFWPVDEHKAINSIDDQLDYICKWYSTHFSKDDKDKENKYKRYCNSLT
jgi:hypothetical protein